MSKISYKDLFLHLMKMTREFITSKDLFIFLFFVLVTSIMWILQTLSTVTKTEINVPLQYEDLPEGFCKSENLCDTLNVEVEGSGWKLLSLRAQSWFGQEDAIKIQTRNYINGANTVSTKKFTEDAKAILGNDVRILSIRPEVIEVKLSKIVSKEVPVMLRAEIKPYTQYVHITTVLSPALVEISGTQESLDMIDTIFTVRADSLFTNIKEVFNDSIELDFGKQVVGTQKKVNVEVVVEQYTEKVIETVAITTIGVPEHQKLRVFPSTAKVICNSPLSKWKDLSPSQFTLAVDYQDAQAKDEKVKIYVLKQPDFAFDVRVLPEKVEYIIDDFGGQ